jgi:Mat/Ecp fimbriae periplasmic chaperone
MAFSFRSVIGVLAMSALLVFSNSLWAAMIVQQSILYFQPGDPSRQDVKITNPDAEPIYIQVEIREVINPGMPNEEIKLVTNPKDAGFLVTPNRLAIQPGSQQSIRLLNMKGLTDSERVFRVALKPVAADVEATETGVKILIGYELLVFIHPIAPKINISHMREGNKLILENIGNVNVLLSKGTQCKDDKNTECTELTPQRLYPGSKRIIDLQYTTPVNFVLTSGMSNQAVVY